MRGGRGTARRSIPLVGPLVKRAKRAAQDDQNALLDAVRRHKGRPSAEQVLPDDDALVGDVDGRAARARSTRRTARAGTRPAPSRASRARRPRCAKRPRRSPFPLRDRIATAIDDGDDGDTGGLVERIGARYREWKNQQLERALGDVLVAAWSRGVYDGVGRRDACCAGSRSRVGRCADCDDNALEPTVKGEAFPTGQAHPPAHPGCRCLLAPAARRWSRPTAPVTTTPT